MVCPFCGSADHWRNGHKPDGRQRYLCKNCGREFAEDRARSINSTAPKLVLAAEAEKHEETRVCGGNGTEKGEEMQTQQIYDEKSDLLKDFPNGIRAKIVQFAVKELSKGRTQGTVETYVGNLRQLIKRGANLYDPETVAETIAKVPKTEWDNATKVNKVEAYDCFLRFLGGVWEKPRYKVEQKLPFIPLETEIDVLIAGCSRTVAAALQVAKDTAARRGEIGRLRWTDVDSERSLISTNEPEKGSKPRVIRVSAECIEMLRRLPRKGDRIFTNIKSTAATLIIQRNRLADKLANPRLKAIHFHTLRHWKATMEYHKNPDPFYVRDLLGHKNIKNTEIYITLERTIFQTQSDEFIVKVATTLEDYCKLLEVGFEYVSDYGDKKVLRKRK